MTCAKFESVIGFHCSPVLLGIKPANLVSLVKDDAGSRQLLVGLDEIAGIRPETGVVFRDHDVPGFPGKTGQPFHLFPPVGRIFTGVGIASVNDNDIPMVFPHQGAERLYSLVKDVVHSTLFAQI